jgi:hypothetical protein
MTVPPPDRATTQSLATFTVLVATLVCVAATWAFVGGVGGEVAKPAATAAVGVETANVGDGVARNDAVVLVHEQGDSVERGTLRVTVDGQVVFVRDLGGGGGGGVVSDVDGDGTRDLARPETTPRRGPRAVDQWYAPVTVGERLVVRERRHPRAADVIDRGDTVRVVCVTADGREVVVAEATV